MSLSSLFGYYFRFFSSCQDEAMSFDDYLDMYSALSEQATRDVKTAYAFRIYDFDGDGVIGKIHRAGAYRSLIKMPIPFIAPQHFVIVIHIVIYLH